MDINNVVDNHESPHEPFLKIATHIFIELELTTWTDAVMRCISHPYLLTPILPCGHPFMSGEPWKAALCWPCCIIGDCVWAMRGESRGLCGVPGPPNVPSACWLIPVDQKRSARLNPRRLVNKPMQWVRKCSRLHANDTNMPHKVKTLWRAPRAIIAHSRIISQDFIFPSCMWQIEGRELERKWIGR